MLDWALSNDGTAVATWISDIVAVIALFAALFVAIVEQRRANRERERAKADDEARRSRFIHTCTLIIGEADQFLSAEEDRISSLGINALPAISTKLPHFVEPILDALDALQRSSPQEGDLALTIARAIRTLKDVTEKRGIDTMASPDVYRNHISAKREDLQRRLTQLSFLRTSAGPLPEELSVLAEYH